MTYTASFYFMGQYRPAYFEAETVGKAMNAALRALGTNHPDYAWFADRLKQAYCALRKGNCSAFSAEHGCRGVSIVARNHDRFLDSVTRDFPAYPGLDYAGVANV